MKYLMSRAAAMILFTLLLGGVLVPAALAAPEQPGKTATILFTSDMHSHLLPAPQEGGGAFGGFARLKTALDAQRAAAQSAGVPTVTVDGGDFSMGTLFQTIYTTQAAELRGLGALGVDATTLGNHEFEYRSAGLTQMLNAAVASGDPLPAIVEANYFPPNAGDEGYDDDAKSAWAALANYGVTDYTMIEKDGVRFAIFGVMGVNADDYAPLSGMVLEPVAKAAQRVVDEIKAKEQYDFILCLSHGGTDPDPKKSEDEHLAKAVSGIDFILSGHTHTTLPEPIVVGNTVIGSVGEYCNYLGKLTISKSADGKIAVQDYALIPINQTLADDPAVASQVAQFKNLVETQFLAQFQMTFDQILAHSDFDFTPLSAFAQAQEEDSLGNLITDGYLYAARQAEGEKGAPITAAFVNSGVIRGTLTKGDITVSDAFNLSSLGSGADGTPGYPLIDCWLTGKELKNVMEIDPSVGPLISGTQLYSAGVAYDFNMRRLLFNRVTDPGILGPDGKRTPIDDSKLYRVVTNLYASQMLGLVTEQSFGILQLAPKDAQGNPIRNFEDHILRLPGGGELKEWYALATYLASFPQKDGTPQIPATYAQPEGRKIRVESANPIELLKQPRWTTVLVILLVVALISALIFGVWFFRFRKNRSIYGKKSFGGRYHRYRG